MTEHRAGLVNDLNVSLRKTNGQKPANKNNRNSNCEGRNDATDESDKRHHSTSKASEFGIHPSASFFWTKSMALFANACCSLSCGVAEEKYVRTITVPVRSPEIRTAQSIPGRDGPDGCLKYAVRPFSNEIVLFIAESFRLAYSKILPGESFALIWVPPRNISLTPPFCHFWTQ
jgi:hypothetical protein